MPTLIVYRLAIKSSYSNDAEEPADAVDFDTMQWWLGDTECWRVRTYAMDNDIHAFLLERPIPPAQAIEVSQRHYGDITAGFFQVDIDDIDNRDELARKLADVGGADTLEFAPGRRLAFWNPDGRRYRAQSTPDD
jgi:hypothetical protein